MRIILIVVTLLTANVSFAQSNISADSTAALRDAFDDDIYRLLELTGSAELGIQVMNQMIVAYKKAMPSIPDSFQEDFMKEVDEQALINLIIPIYKKYYTQEDLKAIIAFYETPVGKKSINVLPNITKDSMTAGQAWGLEIGTKVVNKLKEQGYK